MIIMVLMLIEESEILEWRKRGFKVHKRFKSGGVQMVERKRANNGYVWEHEDDVELRHIRETLSHLSYAQIAEFYIPERSVEALRNRAMRIGCANPLPTPPDLDHEWAYHLYTERTEMTMTEIFKICYPPMSYSKASYWFKKYLEEREKAPIS